MVSIRLLLRMTKKAIGLFCCRWPNKILARSEFLNMSTIVQKNKGKRQLMQIIQIFITEFQLIIGRAGLLFGTGHQPEQV